MYNYTSRSFPQGFREEKAQWTWRSCHMLSGAEICIGTLMKGDKKKGRRESRNKEGREERKLLASIQGWQM